MEWVETVSSLIQIENLTKKFDRKTALHGVNLRVDRGEILAIVGSSGAGKTTLLRLLDLLDNPTDGRILIDEIDTACGEEGRLALRRRIGFVFQRTTLFNTTVYANVAYPLQIRSEVDGISEKVTGILELVGLVGFETRKAVTLSGGEAQRVSLAQSLVFEPEILLLDEPSANLDSKNSAIIEQTITKVNRQRKVTVIIATHNVSQAKNLASKVGVLRYGELAKVGHMAEILGEMMNQQTGTEQVADIYV